MRDKSRPLSDLFTSEAARKGRKHPMFLGNVYSGDEDFFEGSEFFQTEFDWHAPKPSESGWETHSAPDVRHPEEKLAVAIAGKLVMRPCGPLLM